MPALPGSLHVAHALDNPYVERIGMLQSVDHPQGPQRMLRSPIKLNGQRLSGTACPPLSADAQDLLAELGYSADEREQLVGETQYMRCLSALQQSVGPRVVTCEGSHAATR